mmetsp:Transcript_6137/g.15218  ORF Transcript_6137/g.15218 Transcript_6137/m.15218 type:complete len:126 (+) Transcript_6137:581-958(+)
MCEPLFAGSSGAARAARAPEESRSPQAAMTGSTGNGGTGRWRYGRWLPARSGPAGDGAGSSALASGLTRALGWKNDAIALPREDVAALGNWAQAASTITVHRQGAFWIHPRNRSEIVSTRNPGFA